MDKPTNMAMKSVKNLFRKSKADKKIDDTSHSQDDEENMVAKDVQGSTKEESKPNETFSDNISLNRSLHDDATVQSDMKSQSTSQSAVQRRHGPRKSRRALREENKRALAMEFANSNHSTSGSIDSGDEMGADDQRVFIEIPVSLHTEENNDPQSNGRSRSRDGRRSSQGRAASRSRDRGALSSRNLSSRSRSSDRRRSRRGSATSDDNLNLKHSQHSIASKETDPYAPSAPSNEKGFLSQLQQATKDEASGDGLPTDDSKGATTSSKPDNTGSTEAPASVDAEVAGQNSNKDDQPVEKVTRERRARRSDSRDGRRRTCSRDGPISAGDDKEKRRSNRSVSRDGRQSSSHRDRVHRSRSRDINGISRRSTRDQIGSSSNHSAAARSKSSDRRGVRRTKSVVSTESNEGINMLFGEGPQNHRRQSAEKTDIASNIQELTEKESLGGPATKTDKDLEKEHKFVTDTVLNEEASPLKQVGFSSDANPSPSCSADTHLSETSSSDRHVGGTRQTSNRNRRSRRSRSRSAEKNGDVESSKNKQDRIRSSRSRSRSAEKNGDVESSKNKQHHTRSSRSRSRSAEKNGKFEINRHRQSRDGSSRSRSRSSEKSDQNVAENSKVESSRNRRSRDRLSRSRSADKGNQEVEEKSVVESSRHRRSHNSSSRSRSRSAEKKDFKTSDISKVESKSENLLDKDGSITNNDAPEKIDATKRVIAEGTENERQLQKVAVVFKDDGIPQDTIKKTDAGNGNQDIQEDKKATPASTLLGLLDGNELPSDAIEAEHTTEYKFAYPPPSENKPESSETTRENEEIAIGSGQEISAEKQNDPVELSEKEKRRAARKARREKREKSAPQGAPSESNLAALLGMIGSSDDDFKNIDISNADELFETQPKCSVDFFQSISAASNEKETNDDSKEKVRGIARSKSSDNNKDLVGDGENSKERKRGVARSKSSDDAFDLYGNPPASKSSRKNKSKEASSRNIHSRSDHNSERRRRHENEGDDASLPPSSLAGDSRSSTRFKKIHRQPRGQDDGDNYLPPPSLAGDTYVGRKPKENKTVVEAKDAFELLGESFAASNDGMESKTTESNSKKIRRVKVASEDMTTCDESLAPPSLAGDAILSSARTNKFSGLQSVSESTADGSGEKVERPVITRRMSKKAKSFAILECDEDDDSFADDLVADNNKNDEGMKKKKRGSMMKSMKKATSALDVVGKGSLSVATKAKSARNVFDQATAKVFSRRKEEGKGLLQT